MVTIVGVSQIVVVLTIKEMSYLMIWWDCFCFNICDIKIFACAVLL